MKRIQIMILILCALLIMLAACSTNETGQLDIDPNMSVSTITSYVSVEIEVPKEFPASEETSTESISNEFIETTETETATIIEYADIEMPVPFVDEGGDLNAEFYSTVNSKLNYTSMQFISLVGLDEFKSWINTTSSATSEYTSISDLANLYSFIKHFNISNETVREILVNLRNGSEDDFSDEEIDMIISGDDEAVAAHFIADTAILKGSDIYSLKWIYYHPLEDYAAVGITATELEATLPMFDKLTLTDEARQAIEIKITSYAAVSG